MGLTVDGRGRLLSSLKLSTVSHRLSTYPAKPTKFAGARHTSPSVDLFYQDDAGKEAFCLRWGRFLLTAWI